MDNAIAGSNDHVIMFMVFSAICQLYRGGPCDKDSKTSNIDWKSMD